MSEERHVYVSATGRVPDRHEVELVIGDGEATLFCKTHDMYIVTIRDNVVTMCGSSCINKMPARSMCGKK